MTTTIRTKPKLPSVIDKREVSLTLKQIKLIRAGLGLLMQEVDTSDLKNRAAITRMLSVLSKHQATMQTSDIHTRRIAQGVEQDEPAKPALPSGRRIRIKRAIDCNHTESEE